MKSAVARVNHTPGCAFPAGCTVKGVGLCATCARARATASGIDIAKVKPAEPRTAPRAASPGAHIVRIELSADRRRQLGNMAREAGISADELASQLLSALIDDDAAAHESESKPGESA